MIFIKLIIKLLNKLLNNNSDSFLTSDLKKPDMSHVYF